MRDGIHYRGSSHLGQPSLEEPEHQEEPNEAMEIWGDTPEGMGWEPMDLWLEIHEEEAKAKAEAAWKARGDELRRKVA
jgi:hypothetical protein